MLEVLGCFIDLMLSSFNNELGSCWHVLSLFNLFDSAGSGAHGVSILLSTLTVARLVLFAMICF